MSMFNHFIKFFPLPHRWSELGFTGLLLIAGIFCAGEAQPVLKGGLHAQALSQEIVQARVFGSTVVSKGKLPEVDGVYLYGQSPQPQQLGQEYMVFEVRRGKVRGAFYLPFSEFSCFSGTLQSGKLALVVASSPDSDNSSDVSADQDPQQVAAAANNSYDVPSADYPYSVALQSYYQLATVSANDQQILKACKNE